MIEVVADSPASRAGIRVGDLIVEIDGHPMTGVSDLLKLLQHEVIGSPLTLVFLREGRSASAKSRQWSCRPS